jgi:hypothetical protein
MNEPVDGTLDAVFGAANDFVEEASHFLLAWWREAETWSSTGFPPPAKAWRPAQALGSSFGGAAPAATPFRVSRGQAHPALVRRFVVAQQLRDARSSASGGSSAPPPEPQGTANP